MIGLSTSVFGNPPEEPSIGISCDRHAKNIRLNYIWHGSTKFELPDAQEWISTSTLVTVGDRDTERPYWKAKTPTTRNCTIDGKKYVVSVEPHIYNRNILGRCGAVISGAVSIRQGSQEILKRTPFHADCSNTEIVSEITFHAASSRIEIQTASGNKTELQPNPRAIPDSRKSGSTAKH
jgi:hypothetical protein